MLIFMMQLGCVQVTAIIDASDKNTHFILQPNHISNVAEMQPSYVQDVFVNDADVNLLSCVQVATAIDDSVEHTHFFLQPTRIKDAAEKYMRHAQGMSANDADVNLLSCLQVNTVLDVAVERGETGYEFRRDDDDYVSCSISNMW